jgi:hypothetical protein
VSPAIAQGGVQSLGLGARLLIVETGGGRTVDVGETVESQSCWSHEQKLDPELLTINPPLARLGAMWKLVRMTKNASG